jgi:putative spermidine/putrescine transport system ATP-binding protein
MSHLQLNNISKIFNDNPVVEDFNLAVQKGEFVSFLGPSGCGKTTTLRMIAGFEIPSSGQILLDDQEITLFSPNQRNVGMVFQSYALFPNLTVEQNIGFGLQVRKEPKEEIRKRVEDLLGLIHLEKFGRRYPYQLSGGQQQRVALARALAIRPSILLLDEPLSALDAKIRVELRQEIRRVQQMLGITTIYVTHDQEEALSLSDRVVVMSHGKMEQAGTPVEIYNHPASEFVASFVGQINLIPVTPENLTNGMVKVAGWPVRVGRTLDGHNGNSLRLAIRPEELNPGRREGYNNVRGTVRSIQYLGSIVRILLDLDGTPVSMDIFNEKRLHLPEVGSGLDMHFTVDACWLI